jgi:cell division protein FtsB
MAKNSTFRKSRLFKILSNRYLLAAGSLLLWLTFFDRNDFLTTSSYRKKLNDLKAEKDYYSREIINNKTYLEGLETSQENLERFAREKYLMKKENEEIFVIIDERSAKAEN